MLSCSASIELEHPEISYTCGDVVQGNVVVNLTKNINVSEIVIKFKGKTKVTIGEGEYRSVLVNTHYHEEMKVFPPPEVNDQHKFGRLTLNKGTYVYPFKFTLPGHGEGQESVLLPSFSHDFNRIFVRYYIKATIRRPSRLVSNIRAERDVETNPCIDSRTFDSFALSSVTSEVSFASSNLVARSFLKQDGQADARLAVEALYPKRGIRPVVEDLSDVQLHVKQIGDLGGPVTLSSLHVSLFRVGVYKTHVAEVKNRERVFTEEVSASCSLDLSQNAANLSSLISGIHIHNVHLPSFSSRLIDMEYELNFLLTFNTAKGRKSVELNGPINILSTEVHHHVNDYQHNDLPAYETDAPPEYGLNHVPPIY